MLAGLGWRLMVLNTPQQQPQQQQMLAIFWELLG
jgi:hypothetical protein